jgi:hypothetical protein
LIGASIRTLAPIVKHILAQVCSSSSCEWNWNSYSFVHNKVWNHLTFDQTTNLQHPQHNINNMLYTTPTNDGDTCMSRIILTESQARKFDLDITPFKTYLDWNSRGSIRISPRIVVALTSINRSSGWRGAPMGPPPPTRSNEVTTTRSQIKRTTWGQECRDKVAKAFFGDEFDDQGHPNTDRIIEIVSRRHTKCLVTRHVGRAMTVEVHTTNNQSIN